MTRTNNHAYPFPLTEMENQKTSSAHTPGPWTTEPTEDFGAAVRVMDEGECTIALCYQQPFDTWTAEANARIIAAAPDLLKHLKWLVEAAYSVRTNWEIGDLAHAVRALEVVTIASELAIAKATGTEHGQAS